MTRPAAFFVLLATAAVIGGRFLIPGHGLSWPGTYEAFAHIYVGVMFAVAFDRRNIASARIGCGLLLLLATAIETVMFLMRTAQ